MKAWIVTQQREQDVLEWLVTAATADRARWEAMDRGQSFVAENFEVREAREGMTLLHRRGTEWELL